MKLWIRKSKGDCVSYILVIAICRLTKWRICDLVDFALTVTTRYKRTNNIPIHKQTFECGKGCIP